MAEFARVEAGKYQIGSNSIPNAGPVHFREMQAFWIDRAPVTFGHFERFVVSGGYDDECLWCDSHVFSPPTSIDRRCDQLLEHSMLVAESLRIRPRQSVDIPLVGVSWPEASAIARFGGARLPFECEWEVAMQGKNAQVSDCPDDPMPAECWCDAPRSYWGCVVTIPVLQEWTADAFSPKYWRADKQKHGTALSSSQPHPYGVAIRGACSSDLHKDHRFRRAANPNEIHPARGFRRVWEYEPPDTKTTPSFLPDNS